MTEREIERVCKSLTNKRRLAILRLLYSRKKLSVGVIADGIKLSFNATSKHLGILYAAGLLEKEQNNLTVYYSINAETPAFITPLLSVL